MKLSELSESLNRIISREEIDLEREVITTNISVLLEGPSGKKIIHNWEYKRKDTKCLTHLTY